MTGGQVNYVVLTTTTTNFGGTAGLKPTPAVYCGADWGVTIPSDINVAGKYKCAAGVDTVAI